MPSHRQKGLRDRDRGGSFFRTGAKRGVAQEEGGRACFINQRLKGSYRDGGLGVVGISTCNL